MIIHNVAISRLVWLNAFRSRLAIPLILAVTIGLAQLLSVGPQLQTWGVALAKMDQTSIYAAVYKDSLIYPPELAAWLSNGFYLRFFAMAALIAVLGLRSPSVKRLSLSLFAASTLVLTCFDLWTEFALSRLTMSRISVDLLSNAIGSLFIAGWVLILLRVSDFILHEMTGIRLLRVVTAITVPLLAGIVTSMLFFGASKLFFSPLPMKFGAYLATPSGGVFSKNVHEMDKDKEVNQKQFTSFPTHFVSESLGWKSPQNTLSVSWKRPKDSQKYNLYLQFFGGCTGQSLKAVAKRSPREIYKNIQSFDMAFDNGDTEFVSGPVAAGLEANLNTEGQQLFSLIAGSKKNTLGWMQYVGKATLSYGGDPKGISASLIGNLLAVEGNRASLAPRKLTLHINGETKVLHFVPFTPVKWSDRTICSPLPDTVLTAGSATHVGPNRATVGVIATIEPQPNQSYEIMGQSGEFTIKGDSGWVVMNMSFDTAKDSFPVGWVSSLTFGGNVASLRINGKEAETERTDLFQVFQGNIYGRFDSLGRLYFSGTGKFVYKNDSRFNKTLWESLSWPYRGGILTLIGTIFVGFVRVLLLLIKADVKIRILEGRRVARLVR